MLVSDGPFPADLCHADSKKDSKTDEMRRKKPRYAAIERLLHPDCLSMLNAPLLQVPTEHKVAACVGSDSFSQV